MNSWQFLREGDTVDIIAPGSATRPEELSQAVEFLKKWNLRPRFSEKLFSGHPFVANTVKFRVHDLKQALLAGDSKMVWCLRGGYGALQIVPELLKIRPSKRAKLFVGYSDITTLHLILNQKWKWVTCHGPLLDSMGKQKHDFSATNELRELFFGEKKKISHSHLIPRNVKAKRVSRIHGSVMAGNMIVLTSSLGTRHELKTRSKILCLEEIGERGYRIDRMFHQLEQSGALKGCRAIVLGDFVGGQEPGDPTKNFVELAIDEFCERVSIPVFSGLKMGHGPENRAVFLGTKSVLQRQAEGQFEIINASGGKR